jgi:Holliday junction resolvase
MSSRMNTAAKGRRNEYKTRKLLEAKGYMVTRSAASKGCCDLIAIGPIDIRMVQVKTNKKCPTVELEQFKAVVVPDNVIKQVYVWTDYSSEPEITIIK